MGGDTASADDFLGRNEIEENRPRATTHLRVAVRL